MKVPMDSWKWRHTFLACSHWHAKDRWSLRKHSNPTAAEQGPQQQSVRLRFNYARDTHQWLVPRERCRALSRPSCSQRRSSTWKRADQRERSIQGMSLGTLIDSEQKTILSNIIEQAHFNLWFMIEIFAKQICKIANKN